MKNDIYIIQHHNDIRHDIRTTSAQHLYTVCSYLFLCEVNMVRRHETSFVTSLFSFLKNIVPVRRCQERQAPQGGNDPSRAAFSGNTATLSAAIYAVYQRNSKTAARLLETIGNTNINKHLKINQL